MVEEFGGQLVEGSGRHGGGGEERLCASVSPMVQSSLKPIAGSLSSP